VGAETAAIRRENFKGTQFRPEGLGQDYCR
jgi:hypothetical protein